MPQDGLRRILHVDMDAFYASVEQRDDPSLKGRPVAVGGDPDRRGVVAAASYEARRFGVRSALPMSRAVRLCPGLVIVRPDMARYKAASSTVFTIFRSVTPLVEPLSLDEAYLDVTENAWGEGLGVTVARRLKAQIQEETRLTASAGVAPNKLLAKIASGWKKPDGLTVIAPSSVEKFLQKLPVEALWGVGPVTAGKLRALGLARLVDLRTCDPTALRKAVGSWAEGLRELAHGRDDRPVTPDRPTKSASAEETFDVDLVDAPAMRQEIASLAGKMGGWLLRKGLAAKTVTLKVRYASFETVTRSETRPRPTQDGLEIDGRAQRLLDRTEAGRLPVRLLGVGVHGLSKPAPGDDGDLPLLLA